MEHLPAGVPLDPELLQLREELLASIAAAFDRAVEMARRKGAEAAAATATAAFQQMLGQPATSAAQPALPGFGASPSAQAQTQPAPAVKPGRARNGAVQEGVLEVLRGASAPLSVSQIVEEGSRSGHDLKASSVRMAVKALMTPGKGGGPVKVAQDARGDYYIASQGEPTPPGTQISET